MLRFLIIMVLLSFPAAAQEELELTNPSAQDILKQIDGDVGEELEKRIEALKKDAENAPVKVRPTPGLAIEDLKPQKVITSDLANFSVTLDFDANETALSDAHKDMIVQDIPIKFQRVAPARIQVRAFNNTAGIQDNENRRISLLRAIEVREALKAQNIPYKNVDIYPMGKAEDKNKVEIRFQPL